MHTLKIKKLGPISHAEIACNDFMVLTGSQASGKSTIAKALFYFRTIKDDIFSIMIKRTSGFYGDAQNDMRSALIDVLKEKFLNVFGSSWGMDNDMQLEYCYSDNISIKIMLKPDTQYNTPNFVWVELSGGILDYLRQSEFTLNSSSILSNERESIRQQLSALFSSNFDTVFIPAGRSMITLLATQLNYIYSTMDDVQKRAIDFCTRSYLENVIRLRPEFENGLPGLESNYPIKARALEGELSQAKVLIQDILKGSYRYKNGDERLEIDPKHYVKINFTSSGQQEAVWILNLLFYYLLQDNPTFFIIEEPESHLFPDAQKSMMELIALVSNRQHSVLVTTHSPFVLGCFNNMIYAGQLTKRANDDIDAIIPRSFWAERDKVSAWFVSGGSADNCLDKDIGMVQNELIDAISGVINEDFDKLLNISMAYEEAGE